MLIEWSNGSSLNRAREYHTASLLYNGKVLVTGGSGSGGLLNTVELYNPSRGVWKMSGNMSHARQSHTATLLRNGKILVTGGSNGNDLASVELYNSLT